MSKLRLAATLTLPVDAVTQAIGILAKRRAGKSYTARRLAEQLYKAGQQIVIVDPKGDWWGIRSSADGKGPGLPVVILGGERGGCRRHGSGRLDRRALTEAELSAVGQRDSAGRHQRTEETHREDRLMCDECDRSSARNTVIKRAAMDALFAVPTSATAGGHALAEIPGFLAFLSLARQLEALSRARSSDSLDPTIEASFRTAVLGLTPQGRTDVVRLARYVGELANGVGMNVAAAKNEVHDPDMALVVVTIEGDDQERAIVVRVNGDEVDRMPLAPGQDADEALSDAERAMAAHLEHYKDGGR